jgi:hypothetical protein
MKVVQRFRNKEVTQTKVVKNLLRYYNLATAEELAVGKNWYKEANEFCQGLATEYGLEIWKVAGIVAALSPQAEWSQNKRWATEFIRTKGKGFMFNRDRTIKSKAIYKASSHDEVYERLSTTVNGSKKTRAFYRNILLPGYDDVVTLDRHALAAGFLRPDNCRPLSDKESSMTPRQYDFLSSCFVKGARKVDMIPHDFQASLWLTVRRLRGLNKGVEIEGFTPMEIEDF